MLLRIHTEKQEVEFASHSRELNSCPVCKMGRGRSGATKQGRGDSRFEFVVKKNASINYLRGQQKKEVQPFPPELVETFKKIDPKLFAALLVA